MYLHRRRCSCPANYDVNELLTAIPPTLARPIFGRVADVELFTVTLRTSDGHLIAVDVEDCMPRRHLVGSCCAGTSRRDRQLR